MLSVSKQTVKFRKRKRQLHPSLTHTLIFIEQICEALRLSLHALCTDKDRHSPEEKSSGVVLRHKQPEEASMRAHTQTHTSHYVSCVRPNGSIVVSGDDGRPCIVCLGSTPESTIEFFFIEKG